MKDAALQICERLLHHVDAFAHREQTVDFFSTQDRNGHSNRKVPLKTESRVQKGPGLHGSRSGLEGGSFQTRHIY
jgi:hypothetical protein